MAKISDWVSALADQRPDSLMLDVPQLNGLAIKAANAYSAYGALAEHLAIPIADPAPSPPDPYPPISVATDLTVSEWGVIRPLFLLYVEYETATLMEASRGMGVELHGRQTSEIMADIATMESNMPNLAFQQNVTTI